MKTIDTLALFAAACRENTGRHFLDSGGAYGRWHEHPPVDLKHPAVWVDHYKNELTATISTAHWLAEAFDVDTELQDRFDAWAKERGDDWFTCGRIFAEDELHLTQHARDNVYNHDNDFDQVFVWEVYSPEKTESDWIYADEPLVLIYVHTGCDVRGGYGHPLFCRPKGDYAMPCDWCAQYFAEEGRDQNEKELDHDQLRELDEHWTCGYSHWPTGQVNKDIAHIIGHTEDSVSEHGLPFVWARLKSGEKVKITPALPWLT